MASEFQIEQIGSDRYLLGEGPLWDAREQRLYWVDVLQQRVWSWLPETGDFRSWTLPDVVSSFVLCESGGGAVTMSDGFYRLDLKTGETSLMGERYETELPTRFNDGKVDRAGRYIAGTMHHEIADAVGALYSLDVAGNVTVLDRAIRCSNGPCWSLDNTTMYFSDTALRAIFAYPYDIGDGTIGERRVFAEVDGFPDGATVDAEGYVWSATCTKGEVIRYAPDGSVDRRIAMPVQYVTSVAFGGEHLDTLYVTSLNHALNGVPPAEPNSGGLFAVHGLGVRGVEEPRYAG